MSTTSELERLLYRESSLAPAYRAVNDTVAFICNLVVAVIKLLVPHAFTILGLSSIVVAAFSFSTITGFLVLGLALLIFDYARDKSTPR